MPQPSAVRALLAVLDAAFSGFRDAAGRDPRVLKRESGYYTRSIARGFLGGLVGVVRDDRSLSE